MLNVKRKLPPALASIIVRHIEHARHTYTRECVVAFYGSIASHDEVEKKIGAQRKRPYLCNSLRPA